MTEQPPPIHRRGVVSVQARVRGDLHRREQLGIERYGTPLQPHNGRDALRDAYEEALDLSCYLRQVLIERDDDKREAAGLPMTLAGIAGERDALDDSLNEIRDALGIRADVVWRTKAILEAIRSVLGQLEQARRMLVNHDYDVDTHGMDGGLRAALAELAELRDKDCRIDGDLLYDVVLNACPAWMANQAVQDLAARVLADCVGTGHIVVTRGVDNQPWTPEPLADAPVRCCEHAS